MTSAQVVETSVTNNGSFQNYSHLEDHNIRISGIMLVKNLIVWLQEGSISVDVPY